MKVVFCGAYGYGNVGDESYKELFSKHLPGIECLMESPYPDLSAIQWADAVVIGGGGLIYINNSSHFDYFKSYMDLALKDKKPLFFLSCGIQVPATVAAWDDDIRITHYLSPWKPYLDRAEAITVRSKHCLKILRGLTKNTNLHYVPDLAYSIDPAPYRLVPSESYSLFIPRMSKLNSSDKGIEKVISLIKEEEQPYLAAFSPEDEPVIDRLVSLLGDQRTFYDRRKITPTEAASLVKGAKKVYSQRYHGLVLSKAMGKNDNEVTSFYASGYKIKSEVFPKNRMDSLRSIDILKESLGIVD